MILDVGCGIHPHGTVNVDLFLHSNIHRFEEVDKKRIPNLVCADCHYLPFKDKSFEVVYSKHLLEHKGVRFLESCKEMLRITREKVIIQVPNMFRKSKFSSAHDKIFTVETFKMVFRNYPKEITSCGYDWSQLYFPIHFIQTLINIKRFGSIPNPLHYLPCPLATEIKVTVRK